MNINEFERTKPSETRKNIQELKELLRGYKETSPPDASNIWMAAIQVKIKELEDNFIRGK